MTILATEDFAGSGALSANWTQTILAGSGRSTRASDQLQSATVLAAFERRNDVTWPNDQAAKLVIKATTSGADEGTGPAVRISTGGAGTGYFVQAGATDTRLYKVLAGAFTQIGTTGGGVSANDVIELSAVGSTITAKKNGTAFLGSPLTDASIASGAAGFWTAPSTATTDLADDWDGSDTATVPVITAQPQGTAAAVGAAANYTITASGATSYQWQVSTDVGLTWGNVSGGSGGTTASYTTPAAVAGDNGKKYRCVATNASGSTNSLDVFFHVSSLPSAGKGRYPNAAALYSRVDNRWGPPITSPLLLLQTKSVAMGGADRAEARRAFYFGPAVGNVLAVSAALESDSAQAIARKKSRAMSPATEADTAQSIVRKNFIAVGVANETDTAQPITRPVATPVSYALPASRPRPGRGPFSSGKFYVRDTRVYKLRSASVLALGVASETDAAQPITRVKQRVIGIATEADAAQALARAKLRSVGVALESDSAQALTRNRAKSIAPALESDAAQGLARVKLRALTPALESDAAQGLARVKLRALTPALESDAAQGLARVKLRALTPALESDAAQAVARNKRRAVGIASESDVSQPISRSGSKQIAINPALEADAAQSVAWAPKRRLLTAAVEADTALAFSRAKARAAGQALETDAAQAFVRGKRRALGFAGETDIAMSITKTGAKLIAVGMAFESDTAQTVAWAPKRRLMLPAIEADASQPISRSKRRLIGFGGESDAAQALSRKKFRLLSPALELDNAQVVTKVGGYRASPSAYTLRVRANRDEVLRVRGQNAALIIKP